MLPRLQTNFILQLNMFYSLCHIPKFYTVQIELKYQTDYRQK